jgi:hypothetical protein
MAKNIHLKCFKSVLISRYVFFCAHKVTENRNRVELAHFAMGFLEIY